MRAQAPGRDAVLPHQRVEPLRQSVALVLQGDHRARVEKWLGERGVKKISVG